MKKKVFSLMMTLLLAFVGVVRADVVEIGTGTSTNSYLPTYEFYNYSLTQQIYTADEIGMAGTINSIAFYATSSASRTLQVYMVHTSQSAFASSTSWVTPTAADMVYSGSVYWTANGWTTITLSTPFEYNGTDNLCLIVDDNTGSYVSSCAKYVFSPGGNCSIRIYSDGTNYNALAPTSYSGTTMTQKNRIQLDITPAGGSGEQIFAVQDGEIVDTVFVGARPNGCWMEPFTFQVRNTGANTTITNLDWTPQEYFTLMAPELPVDIARNEDIDVEMTTGESNNTDWQMVAIYGTGRTAAVWNIHVDTYDPAIPDVVEMAYDLGTVAAGFSYQGIPSQITPTELHNDYTLPFPEIEEGVDAVYKFTVENDVILNAYVDENAENGKVALYTQDFYGEGGPMATNNYTGLNLNGGNGGSGGGATGAYQAFIGDETSTSTSYYMPMCYLYNYSLSTELYLATELAAAGMTTSPMNSISWYSESTYGYNVQNVSIWMANVTDTEVSATSPLGSGMNLVYQGNFQEVVGWNEFVFNAGNFAWDGHSNVMVMVQMNNGNWSSSIYWNYHNAGFYAASYNYQDSTPYSAGTTTYSMTTTNTVRANTLFKGGNRENNRDLVDFESGNLPAGWDATQGYNTWYVDTEDYYGTAPAYAGTYSLYVDGEGEYENDYFVSPAIQFNGAGTLSFAYSTPSWAGDQNDLSVGYGTSVTGPWTIFSSANELQSESWQTVNIDLSSLNGTYYIAFISYDGYGYCTAIDNINIDVPTTPTPGPTPTPGAGGVVSAGPVIENLGLTAGTYYLVASATQADYDVFINVENMPCPAVDAEGFAFNEFPVDDEDEIEPASVTLQWMNPQYATAWRLIFGTTYYPDPTHDQTIITDWSENMATSYTVTNLWNNTNYFWHVEYKNDACPDGVSSPIWGFTTHLNIPQNLVANDETIFNDETVTLTWNAVVDRTYRMYFIYRDGVKIAETQVNNINATTYTDGPLAYNMAGYTYYVTAIYDEGESLPSNTVTVKVSGYGDVNGHVYEQDGTTGIANATVTMVGTDEFGVPQTYNLTTNGEGYYSGHIYAGTYNGSASCNGYQTIDEPVQGNPIAIDYNQTTSPIDYILDENFDPVCAVIAEYYPDSLDPESPYVKVYWGCGLPGSEIVEPFETGDFSLFDWQIDPTYPWSITTNNPYEGTYCMKSGGAGVANVVSNMTVTVEIPADGLMSFFGKISCESSWDYGYFYIDGVQKGSYTGSGNWAEREFEITAGTHTFQWRYTKDSSVNSYDDCFYVDYITFYKQPAPAIPGMTYDFENSTMQGWTSVDADGDGYGWYVASDIMSTGYGHNGSNDCVLSQSYSNSVGVLYPDNYLVSPQVALGGIVRFYACAQDASYAAEHFGLAVSTTNTNPSSFTMLQEWTMSAKSVSDGGKAVLNSRSGRAQGEWYEFTVDLSAYSGNGYVAIRHFNCSDMFYLDVDDITIGEPGKGIAENRSLNHYRVYRTNCYNEGPYTTENTVLLASVWVPDTVYIDVEWADLEPGVYKWGVGAVYAGNRGEEIEGAINWSDPVSVNNSRATLTYDFDDNTMQNWTSIDADGDGNGWVSSSNPGIYHNSGVNLSGTGHNSSEAYVISGSYANQTGQALYPDNYLVSPQIALGGNITFYACAQDASYAAEHFGVAVSTTNNTSASAFTTIQEWTMTAKGEGAPTRATRDGGLRQGSWYQYTVDLSAYSGMGYVAIRHFNCSDEFILNVDDITIVEGAGGPTPPTPPTPGTNGLQHESGRESEIVWSNCLDKDMWLNGVTVTVLLNSADSPEGTTVSFTNLNEYEQQNYPMGTLTLDETGYYAFESFRRGDYAINVRLEGYEPIDDTVSIWSDTDLRYVMIEILYGVENIYVSRTGWAMWDDSHNAPGGNTPGGGQGGNGDTFSVDFEAGLPAGWNVIDSNNDGYTWCLTSAIPSTWTYYAGITLDWYHNGSNAICSGSYINGVGAINPDEYLVSPQVNIVNGSHLNFWVAATDAGYPADHFGVFVSDNGTSNWTSVAEWTLTAKNGAKAGDVRASRDGNGLRLGSWHNYDVDLSDYAGQKYIAIRHFNCYDQYIMCLDDVELTTGAKNADEMMHFEYYKVMCTSIDGVPIYNHNTVHPFCQLSTNEPYNAPLVEGEHYLCKVATVYSTGMSAWSEPVEWEYEPCDHWGPVDEVTVNTLGTGNHIEWVFENGFNPYGGNTPGPQPGAGEWYYYDNGINEDAIGTGGGNFWWGVMFPAGSYTGNMVTKVAAYDYMAMSGTVTIYQGGATAPGTSVGETNVTFTGSEDFVEFEFAAPVNIDPTQNVWVVFYNASGATYPAAVCANTGDANGRWVSLDGTAWDDLAGYGLDYTFMVRAYIASGAKGEVKEVKVNAPVAQNNGTLAISGNGAHAKTVVENVNIIMMNENTIEFSIADIANYDARVYFLYNLINDNRFSVINAEQSGKFIVSANSNIELKESFTDFVETTLNSFARMDKYQAADFANEYKGTLPMSFTNSMMMDIYAKSRENNMCEFADPFCTDNGMYEFPAGVNAGSGEAGPDYDCLYTTPNPAWYYMRIGDPGAIDIYMYSTPAVDIDFCCWGPFDDPVSPCPYGLTEDKVVDCSYSANPTETCNIPASAQTGEYYILVITNYSNQTCNINFSAVAGAGSTDCGILPPVDIIGFLITMDGEYLAFAGPTDRDYLDEGEFGEHEYCVRPIYPGEMTLPSNNFGWSMGCPVCADGGDLCAPGEDIHGEPMNGTDQVKIWWGDENPGPGPGGCEGDEFIVDFESGIPAGWTTIDADGDGYNWNLGSATMGAGYGHNGSSDMIFSQSYDNNYGALTPDNWLVTPAVTLCENSIFSFYACAQDNAWASEHFGVAVTDDNGAFQMVQEWTMTAKGTPYAGPRGMRDQGNWYQYTVDLGAYAGEGRQVAIRHFNCTDWFYLDVDDIQLSVGAKGLRAGIENYNVYRSTSATGTYALIGVVPAVAGQTYYEYIDTPETAGTYYYQVRADYGDCESEPAQAANDPSVDYVSVNVDAVGENGGMAIYPNPTKDNVTIEANGMRHITVVSTLGQVVFDADVEGDSYIMNMSQYTAGMYTVRVVTENGVSVNRITVVR